MNLVFGVYCMSTFIQEYTSSMNTANRPDMTFAVDWALKKKKSLSMNTTAIHRLLDFRQGRRRRGRRRQRGLVRAFFRSPQHARRHLRLARPAPSAHAETSAQTSAWTSER